MIMDKAGGDGGQGGGAGGGNDQGAGDSAKALADLKAANEALLKRLDALENKNKGGGEDPDAGDLNKKAAAIREKKEKDKADNDRLEAAIKFNHAGKEWAKTHESILPKNMGEIFIQADKENYDSAIAKDSALKSSIITEFFAQQSNLDLLTDSQKNSIEDFKKLTKTDKELRAHELFQGVFEPTFEMIKRIRKAEQLNKGFANPSDAEAAYKQRLMTISGKHYLGEK